MPSRRLLAKYFGDIDYFPDFCEKFLFIEPMGGGDLIPFKLNPIQMWYFRTHVVEDYKLGRPLRHCILKARQFGFSTLISAFVFWNTKRHKSWNSLAIAKNQDQGENIFGMYSTYERWWPKDDAIFPEYPKTRDSGSVLEWQLPSQTHRGKLYTEVKRGVFINSKTKKEAVMLGSKIEVKSGEKKGALGRSGTYQTVHASEAAFWPELTKSLGALLSCCHDLPETAVFIETTANGMNAFHGFWSNMQVGNIHVPSRWKFIFVPWYWDRKYELQASVKQEFINDYEKWLYELILADKVFNRDIDPDIRKNKERIWDKIFWRRQVLNDKFLGDEDEFKQEFPATADEAFMFSGVSVFGAKALDRISMTIKEPKWTGRIGVERKKDEDLSAVPSIMVREPEPRGELKVWNEPDQDHKYVIAADVAEGKATLGVSEEKSKWDFSSASVFCVTTWPPSLKQAASWHGNVDPDEFGHILVALSRWYNDAYLGWEINGPGRSLSIQVINQQDYANVYMREDYDSITKRQTMKPGWRTTRSSKPYMVSVAKRFVRSGEVEIYESSLLSEMKAYSRLRENIYGAAQGHDDRVTSLCIMLTIIEDQLEMIRRLNDEEKAERAENESKNKDGDFTFKEEETPYNPYLGEEF